VRRRIARKLRSSVLLVAALVATGCAIAPPPPRSPIPPSAQRAATLLTERAREFTDLRTLADISAQRGGERYGLRGVILAKSPASVRFEALSPIGPPLLVATIHEGQITAYDATTNEVTTGPATAETAAHLLNLPFEPEELVGILAGRPVPPRDLRQAEMVERDADGPSVNLVGPVNAQRVWMDFETGVVRKLQLSGGRADAVITFRRDPDGTMTGFDLTAGLGYVRSNIRYEQPAFNAGIEPERFAFAPPKSAKTRAIR
jgi:outer membrane lipoprotein-sorting protein